MLKPERMRASPRLCACALSLAVAAGGCGGQAEVPEEQGSGLKTYRHAMDEAPSSLDPVQANNVYASHVVLNAYDTLYAYKYLARPYALKANLAADFAQISPDGLTYTIRLKEGVRFVDDPAFPGGVGREVVAQDVVYSMQRNFDPATRPMGAWLWQGRIVGLDAWKDQGSDYSIDVPGLKALDRHTLQIRLTRPYPQLMDTLASAYAAVVPREAVERYGREFAVRPVGSGPFRVVSYDTSRIIFDRNPNYRREPVDIWAEGYDPATQAFSGVEAIQGRSPPFVDRLILDFIKEDAARWNSFTKGNEVQYTNLPAEMSQEVLASTHPVTLKPEFAAKYHVYAGLEAGFVFNSFNMSFPEFGYNPDPGREARNKALRCAVIKGFDWKARNESWYFGLAAIFPGIIVPVVPEYDASLPAESVTRDVDGARRSLAENGWNAANLPVLTYGGGADVKDRLFYEQFRAWMKEIGYPAEKVVLKRYATFGDLTRAFKENELPLIEMGWQLDYPDAENTLQLFYGPNSTPGSNNANYRNPEYDALYEQASVMLPSPERTALYQRMNRMVIDDCVAMTGIARTRIYLWHKNVIAVPDREIVGGFFLRYVDVVPRAPEEAS
jgi:ABC-type transport system substrate-binding protein